jgi:hypothetical protein
MMGEADSDGGSAVLPLSLEQHVSADHLLRSIDRFVDLSHVRKHLEPVYNATGRQAMIRN